MLGRTLPTRNTPDLTSWSQKVLLQRHCHQAVDVPSRRGNVIRWSWEISELRLARTSERRRPGDPVSVPSFCPLYGGCRFASTEMQNQGAGVCAEKGPQGRLSEVASHSKHRAKGEKGLCPWTEVLRSGSQGAQSQAWLPAHISEHSTIRAHGGLFSL